ncbi:DUF2163 domain-containing protein [uncultured Erythrobacter sp.]|uniref:DUF2163 domain-containing protein n=1 Tax=uncultured Erythrobacter sp. TaxID=263913 RepID=UPI0026364F37|nr:DUF2163 domain-containing protein [uncultured Erythrobacter sp.]
MRAFFNRELESAATFWRVFRRDGVALGFSSHDRDLAFAGLRHRTAPGMVPAAIRMTSDLSEDSASVEGTLSHDSISSDDLAAGLFDNAAIEIGIVDWETLEHHSLYSGVIGRVEDNQRSFSADLLSAKHVLEQDLVPRTSPTCRAVFCGLGCGLSSHRFTQRVELNEVDFDFNQVRFSTITSASYVDGQLRFLSGPQTGLVFGILSANGDWLTLDRPLHDGLIAGTAAELTEGCDHTLGTCSSRFDNAVNFRGEPFLPGNDLLARYGQ